MSIKSSISCASGDSVVASVVVVVVVVLVVVVDVVVVIRVVGGATPLSVKKLTLY